MPTPRRKRKDAWAAGLAHIAAIFFAALTPAIIFGLFSGSARQALGLAPAAFIVTLGHALVVGLPAYLVLRQSLSPRLINAAGVGFIVGGLPVLILMLATGIFSPGTSSSVGGVPTMVNGVVTFAGLLSYLLLAALAGALGATGGLTFALVLRSAGVFAHIGAETWRPRLWVALGHVAGAGAVVAGFVAWNAALQDRTCHNYSRDGRNSIPALLVINLDLPVNAWPSVTEEVGLFATDHGMRLRDEVAYYGHPTGHGLSLCTDTGMNISVSDWRAHGLGAIDDRAITLTVLEPVDPVDWHPIADDLVKRLEARWPDRVSILHGGDSSNESSVEVRIVNTP